MLKRFFGAVSEYFDELMEAHSMAVLNDENGVFLRFNIHRVFEVILRHSPSALVGMKPKFVKEDLERDIGATAIPKTLYGKSSRAVDVHQGDLMDRYGVRIGLVPYIYNEGDE